MRLTRRIVIIFVLGLIFYYCGNNQSYYKDPIDLVHFQDLLKARKFAQLNQELDVLQQEFKQDFSREFHLVDAYRAFGITSADFETFFNEWIKQYPQHYQPYIARAEYYHRLGWESRGYDWASKTSHEQFRGMIGYFTKARIDAQKALALNENCFVPYLILLGVNSSGSFNDSKEELVHEGLKINPNSLILRAYHLQLIQPKWGGSIEQMKDFIKKSETYYKTNPALKALKGFPYMTVADALRNSEKYHESKQQYQKALSFGDYYLYYVKLANIYLHFKEYQESLKSINKAIQLSPNDWLPYHRRAVILGAMGDLENAWLDMNRIKKMFPNRDYSKETKRYISACFVHKARGYYDNTDYLQALTQVNRALEIDSTSNTAYHMKGIIFFRQRKFDEALAAFKKSIELDPTYYYSYKGIDDVLIRQKKKNFAEIIKYWNQYIEQVPDNADAYVERAGTYFRERDWQSSLKDAQQAAQLDPKYQSFYEKLKQRIGKQKKE